MVGYSDCSYKKSLQCTGIYFSLWIPDINIAAEFKVSVGVEGGDILKTSHLNELKLFFEIFTNGKYNLLLNTYMFFAQDAWSVHITEVLPVDLCACIW